MTQIQNHLIKISGECDFVHYVRMGCGGWISGIRFFRLRHEVGADGLLDDLRKKEEGGNDGKERQALAIEYSKSQQLLY